MKHFCTCVVAGALVLALPVVCLSEDLPVEFLSSEPTVDGQGSLTVLDNLHIEGNHADLGTTSDGNVALLLSYQESGLTRQVVVYASQSAVEYLWKEGGDDPASGRAKMLLGADNSLALYDSSGTETIKLSAVSGEVSARGGFRLPDNTLLDGKEALRSTALYSATGQVVAEVDEDGTITFKNGIALGAGNTAKLTESNVAYLQDILSKFGYQENPVEGTDVSVFLFNGDHRTLKVTEDASGNRIFAGQFSGDYFKLGSAELWGSESSTSNFVTKFSVDGKLTWSKMWYADGILSAVCGDASGNTYVAGYLRTAKAGQKINIAGISVTSTGGDGYDGYVVKLSTSGIAQWVKLISGNEYKSLQDIAVDAASNVYVCGEYLADAGTVINLAGTSVMAQGGYDGFVVKLNKNGEGQWAKTFGATGSDSAHSLALDSTGNVYVAGHINQTAGKAVSLAGTSINALGGSDGYVVKLNGTGAVQWAKLLGGTSADQVAGIAVDGTDALYVAGYITGTAGKTLSLTGKSVTFAGSSDGYLLKLNSAGAAQWATVLGSTSSDNVNGISIGHDGSVYLVGHISGNSGGSATLAGVPFPLLANGTNCYVLKLNNAGVGQWAKNFFGSLRAVYATTQDTLLVSGISSQSPMVVGNSAIPGGWLPYIVEIPVGGAIVDKSAPASTGFSWGNAIATGELSLAMGDGAYAAGNKSLSLGANANANGYAASVIGGEYSVAIAPYASVVGGNGNSARGIASFVGGGQSNAASGSGSVALGGWSNNASGLGSVVAGGLENSARAPYSAIVGGNFNMIESGSNTFIGGGVANYITGDNSAILGGTTNRVSGNDSVSMGFYSTAQAAYSVVIGSNNVAQGSKTTWIATDDVFVVGNGRPQQWGGERSNALAVHKNGDMRLAGGIDVKRPIRVPPGGDIPMGDFTSGKNPSNLDAGLRYEGE